MSATQQRSNRYDNFRDEPAIRTSQGTLERIDPRTPLHQFVMDRISSGRDVKIIITAESSQTGVGKTTLAGWLAMNWNWIFTGEPWHVDPDDPTDGLATLNPHQYFNIISRVGTELDAGTVVLVDDAEELDARRAMQGLNVEFSQRWMLMRLKQAITIITLPSPSSIDSRLEELADVWINVERRGMGLVHAIGVESYQGRDVYTKQKHRISFPDVSEREEMQDLQRLKEQKMDSWEDADEEPPDPDEIKKQLKRQVAQNYREAGLPIQSQDPDQPDIVSGIGMSQSWVSKNTTAP